MKEIVVTKCGPEQDRYYIIEGADIYMNGIETPIEGFNGIAELFDCKIKEVTRLHVGIDATVVVDVGVEGDEDAALERASEIAGAFEKEVDKISMLSDTESASLGIADAIFWRNEDSGEETYR